MDLAYGLGIDIRKDSWKKYIGGKNLWYGKDTMSVVDLGWVVNELLAVKEGRARAMVTPDGIFTIVYNNSL